MNPFDESIASDAAQKVLAGENPLIPFDQTYAMHEQLKIRGALVDGNRLGLHAAIKYIKADDYKG
jgi:hypothetical protein